MEKSRMTTNWATTRRVRMMESRGCFEEAGVVKRGSGRERSRLSF